MNLLTMNIGRLSLLVSAIVLFFIFLLPVASLSVESEQKSLATAAVNENTSDMDDSNEKEHSRDAGVISQKADNVGKKVDDKIDNLSQRATSQYGDWKSIEVFSGISWFKLILSLFLFFAVVLFERLASMFIRHTKRKIEERSRQHGIRYLMIDAASRPTSMFIWIYGIYIAATPLLGQFQQPDGTNTVSIIAQKSVDFSAALALVWFIIRLFPSSNFILETGLLPRITTLTKYWHPWWVRH